ncbi:MATE family efflux transporter [Flammeovirga pectinis]|uniref:Multidrug export protein MepA n=1 Tax=Flammeovirga pectinis TaxID=2494373 RepID=A0A3S9P347_9BACT|nr:MATE family efflux transporter [Flammeovirga pectinis]AZQ62502.1 MATE family efflux transporter [Flammeovirga pectinis]
MAKSKTPDLGLDSIKDLLVKLSVPAAVGMMVIVIYQMVDTFFIGRWVGTLGIAGISVVAPLVMLVQSIGMAIGMGGASLIARALGGGNPRHACKVLGTQSTITLILTLIAVVLGVVFEEKLLVFFGANGDIYSYAQEYYHIVIFGMPFLTMSIMSNNGIRSEGKAKTAMMSMIIPGVINIILDPIFIVGFEMGMQGAAWATLISYVLGFFYVLHYYLFRDTVLKLRWQDFILDSRIVKETMALGSASFVRQGASSGIAIILNHILFDNGGELSVAVYGVISRLFMLATFPMIGLGQGFLTICSFNYGACNYKRVKEVIYKSIIYGSVINTIIVILVFIFNKELTGLFTKDVDLITESVPAIFGVMTSLPFISIGIISSMYAQAVGKAKDALLLTLNRQVIFRIPFVFLFSHIWGIYGTWGSFFVADIFSLIVAAVYMKIKINRINNYLTQ